MTSGNARIGEPVGVGTSMLPSILPGARLELAPVAPGALRVGDVICFLGEDGGGVAHRLVAMRNGADGVHLVVRGDAQTVCEEVPAQAVIARVEVVHNPRFSYSADGPVGAAFAALALRAGWSLSVMRRLAMIGGSMVRGARLFFHQPREK